MKPRCAILVRVSTLEQETARQIADLQMVCDRKGWEVVEVVQEEGIRGSSKVRPGLNRLIHMVASKAVDKVAVHEISRIARKNSVAHHFLELCNGNGVSLYWHSQGIETLLDSGKPNPAAGMMFALLSEMARAESETLGMRVRSGMAEARRKGVRIGRPAQDEAAFLAKYGHVVDLLRSGMSIRKIAAETGVNHVTVQKVKRKAT